MITGEGDQEIPWRTLRGTENFPKNRSIHRGDSADSGRPVHFSIAIRVDYTSENNKGDSTEKEDWTQEVDLAEVLDATARENVGQCWGDTPQCGQEIMDRSSKLSTELLKNRAYAMHTKFRTGKDQICVQ